jgi:hypothetical protein
MKNNIALNTALEQTEQPMEAINLHQEAAHLPANVQIRPAN